MKKKKKPLSNDDDRGFDTVQSTINLINRKLQFVGVRYDVMGSRRFIEKDSSRLTIRMLREIAAEATRQSERLTDLLLQRIDWELERIQEVTDEQDQD